MQIIICDQSKRLSLRLVLETISFSPGACGCAKLTLMPTNCTPLILFAVHYIEKQIRRWFASEVNLNYERPDQTDGPTAVDFGDFARHRAN